MTNFVTSQQVIQVAIHVLPDRQHHRTILEVEVCGLDILVRDRDILARQEFGEDRLGSL